MDSKKFISIAKDIILNYINSNDNVSPNKAVITDVYVVWSCKTLQNNKALLSTSLADGMYYEVTYNGDKNEFYLDAYKKWKNIVVRGD